MIMATNFEKNNSLVISTLFEASTNNVYNMSRREARKWEIPLIPEKNAWISIGEPDVAESIVVNPILEKLRMKSLMNLIQILSMQRVLAKSIWL